MWYPAYISLGSNLNKPKKQVQKALDTLANEKSMKLVSYSSFYQTEPYGGVEQDDFINAAAALLTTLSAEELLSKLLNIETQQGRVRTQHWGPRCIDLDLLVYSDLQIDTDFLKLPHPEISKRDFVLIPLAEIAPELMIVSQGRVHNLLNCVTRSKVFKV